MHTVELLELALASACDLGFDVREEWLGGVGGGTCLTKGRWRLFVDLDQTPRERLEQVLEILARSEQPSTVEFPATIRCLVQARRAA